MAGECDKPKKEDPPIKGSLKGDKGKGDKGKTVKGKPGDSGKGKPQLNKVEADTAGADERAAKKQDSNPKEPEEDPGRQLEEFHKTVIKMLKEKERINNPMEELSLIVDAIKKTMDAKFKTVKIRKIRKDERRYGLLDSGATNNVREVKKKESLKGLVPIEVEVAFDSE